MSYKEYITEIEPKGFQLKYERIQAISGRNIGVLFFFMGVALAVAGGICLHKILPEIHLVFIIVIGFFIFTGIIAFYEKTLNRRKQNGWMIFNNDVITLENNLREVELEILTDMIADITMVAGNDGGTDSPKKFNRDEDSVEIAFALNVRIIMVSGERIDLHVLNLAFASVHHKKLWQVVHLLKEHIYKLPAKDEMLSATALFEKIKAGTNELL